MLGATQLHRTGRHQYASRQFAFNARSAQHFSFEQSLRVVNHGTHFDRAGVAVDEVTGRGDLGIKALVREIGQAQLDFRAGFEGRRVRFTRINLHPQHTGVAHHKQGWVARAPLVGAHFLASTQVALDHHTFDGGG